MILIFDDNSFRLQKNCKKIRLDGFFVKGDSYEHCEYITKPMLTVLVSPEHTKIAQYMRDFSAEKTICVLVLKKEIPEMQYARNVIISPDGEINTKDLIKIIKSEYGYNLCHDMINYILIDEEDKDVYFGNKRLFLTDKEYEIVRFFAYNRAKKFTIDEINEYLHLKIKETTFSSYISKINTKCYNQHREDIILRTSYGYGITPVTGIFKL
ncbi:MAG: hypothetical protein J6A54_02095 [Clostridia bacterium]|nr:hypothetical protein [Clostridia bacterium]